MQIHASSALMVLLKCKKASDVLICIGEWFKNGPLSEMHHLIYKLQRICWLMYVLYTDLYVREASH